MNIVNLNPGERIVDNFHFVAMDGTIKYKIRRFGDWETFLFESEGLVVEVEGPGRIILHFRSLPPPA